MQIEESNIGEFDEVSFIDNTQLDIITAEEIPGNNSWHPHHWMINNTLSKEGEGPGTIITVICWKYHM